MIIIIISTVIREWNSLPLNFRALNSLSTFTHAITSDINVSNAEEIYHHFFDFGDRIQKFKNSKFKYLHIKIWLIQIRICPLCTLRKVKHAYHFFFSWTKYAESRNELFDNISAFAILQLFIHIFCFGEMPELVRLWMIFILKNQNDFDYVYTFLSKCASWNLYVNSF